MDQREDLHALKNGPRPDHVERAQAAAKTAPRSRYEVTRDPHGTLWLLKDGQGLVGGKVDIIDGMVRFSVPLEHVPVRSWEELEARAQD